MNRDEKAIAIGEIATHIEESNAIFAVDYRGITVPDAAELRAKLREADATFTVVKNSLTERAADQVGADTLKDFLSGPTALTFVRGDIAVAAKAIADQARATQLLPFKGGLMEGAVLDPDQIRAISRLPSRDALYGQLVGIVAAPIGGLVRSLNALVSGLAVALGQVQEKKASGEIPAGEPPAVEQPATAEEPSGGDQPAAEAESDEASQEQAPAEDAPAAPEAAGEATAEEAQEAGDEQPANEAEPEKDEPAQEDDNQADVSAEAESQDAETSTKED